MPGIEVQDGLKRTGRDMMTKVLRNPGGGTLSVRKVDAIKGALRIVRHGCPTQGFLI